MPPDNYRSHGVIIAIVIREGGEPRPMGSVQKDVRHCVCVCIGFDVSLPRFCVYIYFFFRFYIKISNCQLFILGLDCLSFRNYTSNKIVSISIYLLIVLFL